MHLDWLALRVAKGGAELAWDQLRGRQRPFIVNHLVTVRCNLRCPFCYVSGPEQVEFNKVKYPKQSEMTTEQLRSFYRQLVDGGFKLAVVLGGEPLLRTDFDDFLSVLKGHLFVTVFTNGFLLAERAELLKSASTVFVSLDAPDAQHDELRACEGSFERAMRGIDVLRRTQPQVKVAVNMTVTKKNAHRVSEMLALARRLGVPVGFQPPSFEGQFEVSGRPHTKSEGEAASEEAVASAFRIVRAASERGERVIGTGAFFDHVIEGGRTYPCHYPRWVLGPVLPNGDVVGCTSSSVIGNVRESTVADVVASEPFKANARTGPLCPHGCRDWGIFDVSAVYGRRFKVRDARRYFQAFVR